MRGLRGLAWGFVFFVFSHLVQAETENFEPTYGLELTFSNRARWHASRTGRNRKLENEAMQKFLDAARNYCEAAGNCKVVKKRNKDWYEVRFDDGWAFEFNNDPFVVEVQLRASTLKTLRENADRIR